MVRQMTGPDIEKNRDQAFIDGFCALLVKSGALKNRDAQELQELFERSTAIYFEDFLLEEDIVSKEDMLQTLSEYYQMPAVDVIGVFFDHHLVRMFPKDVMLRDGFIPFERDGDILLVIAARPRHPALSQVIGDYVSYDVAYMVGIYNDITDQVQEFYDQSIETAEIQMFEDTTDKHEEQERLDDIVNGDEEE